MKTKAELVELLRTDIQAFNAYRQELFEQKIYILDLSHVDLEHVNLRGANLSNANLNGANLNGADLNDTNLSSANLFNANLSRSHLVNTNLSGADLRNVNLKEVNLWSTNLESAKLDQEFIQVAGLGSERRMTTYLFSDDLIFCGCFKGTLKEFKKRVKKTYPEEENRYRNQYLDFIKMINKEKKRIK